MISQTAEYALRAVAHMASQGEGALLTVGQIASATLVPADYLSKVLQKLSRAGIIVSYRGAGGGFRLANAAEKIAVYDVVQTVDPLQRIYRCPLNLEAHGDHLCPLHQRLDDATSLIEQQFRATSIADLLSQPESIPQTATPAGCTFPAQTPPQRTRAARTAKPKKVKAKEINPTTRRTRAA